MRRRPQLPEPVESFGTPDADSAPLHFATLSPPEQAQTLDGIYFALRPGEAEYHRRWIPGEASAEPANDPGDGYELWMWIVHNPKAFGDILRVGYFKPNRQRPSVINAPIATRAFHSTPQNAPLTVNNGYRP